MTGPQGMGPLQGIATLDPLSQYDIDVMEEMDAIFYIRPKPYFVTYTDWETWEDAIEDDIAREASRGRIYFRAWTLETGFLHTYEVELQQPEYGIIIKYLPESSIDTYTDWETWEQAITEDIAREASRGRIYFRAWTLEAGEIHTYEGELEQTEYGVIIKYLPETTWPSYTDWETRSEAYSGDIAREVAKGRIYFRSWFLESGNAGEYEDVADDSPVGGIYKIEDDIT